MAALQRAGAVAADLEAANVVRLEHGKPRYGEDLSERFLAQEANQVHALHFNKGCYINGGAKTDHETPPERRFVAVQK